MSGVELSKIVRDFKLEVVADFGCIEGTTVTVADVTRPGLQLAGHFEHFGPDRIQIVGNMELGFLSSLSIEERSVALARLFATRIPCLILTRNHEASELLLRHAAQYQVPVLRSPDTTSTLIAALIKYLSIELAPFLTQHGVLVEVYGEGILIAGESGVGKSETALELVKRGHRLIADDAVEIRRVSDTTLLGRSPSIIRHFIEIRGIGILDVKELYGVSSVKLEETIHLILNMENWDEKKHYDRIGMNEETTELLGVAVPSVTVPVRPGRNLAVIVEAAAINTRQRTMGYNAAKELVKRRFGDKYVEVQL